VDLDRNRDQAEGHRAVPDRARHLFLLGANPSNGIVKAIHDVGAWLVGPFKNLFSIHDAERNEAYVR
jgi:hypothetical protein